MMTDRYLRLLQKLLPPGDALTREEDAFLTRLLRSLGKELGRVHLRADGFIDEIDPRTANEMLPDWELTCGFPDPCLGALETTEERSAAVMARLASLGGQSIPFFISLAADAGYGITITEFRPFSAGSSAGDSLTNGEWPSAWQVNAPETTIRSFSAGSRAGEPLRAWGNTMLECAINRFCPPHTFVIYAYGG